MPRLLSLAHLTVLAADPVELVEIAAQANFDAVGLRIQPPLPGDTVQPVVGEPAIQRAIRRALADTGVMLLDVEAFWLSPNSNLDDFKRGYETGAELGARFALIVGNDPDRGRLSDQFARTCADALAFGLVPILEFIPYSAVRTLSEARELIERSGAKGAGLLVDALHLSRSGGSPADIGGLPADLFKYIHLCDAPLIPPPSEQLRPEARGGRQYPGDGGLWLEDLLAAFPADLPVAVEAPSAKHASLPLAEQALFAARGARLVIERANRRYAAPERRELGVSE